MFAVKELCVRSYKPIAIDTESQSANKILSRVALNLCSIRLVASPLLFLFFSYFWPFLVAFTCQPVNPSALVSFLSVSRATIFTRGWWMPAGKKPDSNCLSRQQYWKKVLQRIEEGFCCLGDKEKKMSKIWILRLLSKWAHSSWLLGYKKLWLAWPTVQRTCTIDACILFLFYLTAEHDQNK